MAPDWDIKRDAAGAWHAAGPLNVSVLDGGRCFKRRSIRLKLNDRPGRRYLAPALEAIAGVAHAAVEAGPDGEARAAWERLLPTTTAENVLAALDEISAILVEEAERRQLDSQTTTLVGELDGVKLYANGDGQVILTRQDLYP